MSLPGESPHAEKGQPGIIPAALYGLCPRCSAPGLFGAPAAIAEQCRTCGLAFRQFARGSRWAGVLTLLLAGLLTGAAMLVDMLLAPPLWLQLAFWAPVTVSGVIFALRLYKTVLLYAAYQRAGE